MKTYHSQILSKHIHAPFCPSCNKIGMIFFFRVAAAVNIFKRNLSSPVSSFGRSPKWGDRHVNGICSPRICCVIFPDVPPRYMNFWKHGSGQLWHPHNSSSNFQCFFFFFHHIALFPISLCTACSAICNFTRKFQTHWFRITNVNLLKQLHYKVLYVPLSRLSSTGLYQKS